MTSMTITLWLEDKDTLRADPNYMQTTQTDMDFVMRSVIIDWMVDVHSGLEVSTLARYSVQRSSDVGTSAVFLPGGGGLKREPKFCRDQYCLVLVQLRWQRSIACTFVFLLWVLTFARVLTR